MGTKEARARAQRNYYQRNCETLLAKQALPGSSKKVWYARNADRLRAYARMRRIVPENKRHLYGVGNVGGVWKIVRKAA